MKKVIKRTLATLMTVVMLLTATSFASRVSAKTIKEYSVGDVVEFGSYPQSKVTDKATLAALDRISKTWISYGYYIGTGNSSDGKMKPSDYMKYCDVSYNGNKYRAVTFSSYRAEYTSDTLDRGNSWQYVNGYYADNVYYFRYDPLKWRVLDPSEGFVMCTTAIDAQAYNNYVIYNSDNCKSYSDSAMTYYASDWENCSLRAWLNDDFYNTAFDSTEKSQIFTTRNENKNTETVFPDGANTLDKIFLLSYFDVLNSEYGFSPNVSESTTRQIKSTDYAKCQGCWESTFMDGYPGNSPWRLRSPFKSALTAYVGHDGCDWSTVYVDSTFTGIVPALRFSLKSSSSFTVQDELKLNYKSNAQISTLIYNPDDLEYTVTYESSNPGIATVDNNGNVYGAKVGSATITCTVTGADGLTVSDTCKVTVSYAWWQWIIEIVLLGFLWY